MMRRLLLIALGLILVGALVMMALPGGRAALVQSVAWLRASGDVGRAVAVALVLVGIPLGIPTLWFAALIGYVYGLAGLAISLPAVVLGATAAFAVGRWLLRDDVARLVQRRRVARAVADAVGEEGGRLVVLLRLAGPHNLLNLALSASPLSLGAFVWGTAVGSVPSVGLATVGGALAPDAAAVWRARDALGPVSIAVGVAGAVALLVAIYFTVRATRRALARVETRAARTASAVK